VGLQGLPVDVLGQTAHEDSVGITSTAAATTARAIAAATHAAATTAATPCGVLAVLEVATTFLVLVARIRARIGSGPCLLAATIAATIAATVAATRFLLLPTRLTATAFVARVLDDVVQGPGQRASTHEGPP
jgi:hypothetical protein